MLLTRVLVFIPLHKDPLYKDDINQTWILKFIHLNLQLVRNNRKGCVATQGLMSFMRFLNSYFWGSRACISEILYPGQCSIPRASTWEILLLGNSIIITCIIVKRIDSGARLLFVCLSFFTLSLLFSGCLILCQLFNLSLLTCEVEIVVMTHNA